MSGDEYAEKLKEYAAKLDEYDAKLKEIADENLSIYHDSIKKMKHERLVVEITDQSPWKANDYVLPSDFEVRFGEEWGMEFGKLLKGDRGFNLVSIEQSRRMLISEIAEVIKKLEYFERSLKNEWK